MPEARLLELARLSADSEKAMPWVPNPGPQSEAYACPADLLLYGGQGGGGKSDILLGLAFTAHRRSLLLRRQYTDLSAITERAIEINGARSGFNGASPPKLRTRDGRLIEFGATAKAGDEQHWQGQPHDLIGLDEAVQFLESQVRFLLGWNRSTDAAQRCRAVLASNPPVTAEGRWIVGMFRPWLDLTYPKPAKPGEIRWFVTDPDGKDVEVAGPAPHQFPDTVRAVMPKSRSFIPASLADNPFLVRTKYQATLDALPEPLRSAVRDGNFMAARVDDEFQVIPTTWIIAAEARWRPNGYKDSEMTAMALDPAGGGRDSAELAARYGGWYAALVSAQGAETADGSTTAATVTKYRRNNCPVVVDVGGGYGGAVMLRLRDNGVPTTGFNGAGSPTPGRKTKDGQLNFANKRAEAWWRFREELDPDQEGGSIIALPPDAELRADLAAPTWKLTPRGIVIEDKDSLRKRLGRSPGKGDAVVMCLSEGERAAMRAHSRYAGRYANGNAPQVLSGRPIRRR